MDKKNIFTKSKDAFGEALYHFLKNKAGEIIIERDDGNIEVDHPTYYFDNYKNWRKSIKKGLSYAKSETLDVGAGAGRFSLYLQSKKISVTALDNSPKCIKVCKQRGVKKTVLSDIMAFKTKNRYNAVLLLGNNFGLLHSKSSSIKILKKIDKYTTSDAIVILETLDPYNTKDKDHIAYHRINKSKKRMGGQIRFRIRFKKFKSPFFDYLFVSQKELEDIVSHTNWKISEILSEKDHPCYVAVLRKMRLN